MAGQIPLVDYLVLDDGDPHLIAQECTSCGARFFDRRNACAGCFATGFKTVPVATEGTVRAFTIVTFAAPGIPTPFVASVVDCDGTQVRANLINVDPDPDHVRDGMKVRLATYPMGTDSEGTAAAPRLANSNTNRRGPQYGRDRRNSNNIASTSADI